MQKQQIVIGGIYTAKVSGRLTRVQILRAHDRSGWYATNVATGRQVRIRTAARLRAIPPEANT